MVLDPFGRHAQKDRFTLAVQPMGTNAPRKRSGLMSIMYAL
jgi:hypothetical protein